MKDKKKITDHRSNKDIMKKVLDHIGKYKFFLLFSIVLAAVSVVLTLYIPILTGQAVDCILGPGAVDFDGIWAILKKMAVIIVITAAVQWLMNTCNNKIAYQVVRDVRDEAFKKLQILPLKYIDGHSHGDIVSRIIADVDQFSDGLLLGFTQLFTGIVTIIGTLIFMFSINVSTTVVVVILTPLSFFIAGFIAKRTFNMSKLQSETRGEQTALIDEMIGNEKVVKAFNHEPQVMEQFEEINGRLEKASVKAIFFSSLTNPCTRFVNSLVYAGVGILGASILVDTVAVAQSKESGILLTLLCVIYAANVVSPLPLLPDRFLARIGHVYISLPSYASTSAELVMTTSLAPHSWSIFAATNLSVCPVSISASAVSVLR